MLGSEVILPSSIAVLGLIIFLINRSRKEEYQLLLDGLANEITQSISKVKCSTFTSGAPSSYYQLKHFDLSILYKQKQDVIYILSLFDNRQSPDKKKG